MCEIVVLVAAQEKQEKPRQTETGQNLVAEVLEATMNLTLAASAQVGGQLRDIHDDLGIMHRSDRTRGQRRLAEALDVNPEFLGVRVQYGTKGFSPFVREQLIASFGAPQCVF